MGTLLTNLSHCQVPFHQFIIVDNDLGPEENTAEQTKQKMDGAPVITILTLWIFGWQSVSAKQYFVYRLYEIFLSNIFKFFVFQNSIFELQWGDRGRAYVSWAGDMVIAAMNNGGTTPTLQINGLYANKLGLCHGEEVGII